MDLNLLKYGSCTLLMVQHLAKWFVAGAEPDCHSETCRPIEEYCSQFEQTCMPCSRACDPKDLKYEPSVCNRQCSGEFFFYYIIYKFYLKMM